MKDFQKCGADFANLLTLREAVSFAVGYSLLFSEPILVSIDCEPVFQAFVTSKLLSLVKETRGQTEF